MSVTLIADHVLLPHRPDWTRPVAWSRVWQTEVARSLSGLEARRAMRSVPRRSLEFELASVDLSEQTALLARVHAASKAGLACCPYWGRGLAVSSATAKALTLATAAWDWLLTGDYLYLANIGGGVTTAFEVVQVTAMDGAALTLKVNLVGAWGAGTYAWPLLYGKVTFGDLTHRTDWHARVSVTLIENLTFPDPSGEPQPPPWLDVCFLNPWGGCESWANLWPDQTLPLPTDGPLGVPGNGTLYAGGAYVCFGTWQYTVFGPRGARTEWTQANGTTTGSTMTVTVEPVRLELPAALETLKTWVGVTWGAAGSAEDWSSIPDGNPGASWSATNTAVNVDVPVAALGTWTANAFT